MLSVRKMTSSGSSNTRRTTPLRPGSVDCRKTGRSAARVSDRTVVTEHEQAGSLLHNRQGSCLLTHGIVGQASCLPTGFKPAPKWVLLFSGAPQRTPGIPIPWVENCGAGILPAFVTVQSTTTIRSPSPPPAARPASARDRPRPRCTRGSRLRGRRDRVAYECRSPCTFAAGVRPRSSSRSSSPRREATSSTSTTGGAAESSMTASIRRKTAVRRCCSKSSMLRHSSTQVSSQLPSVSFKSRVAVHPGSARIGPMSDRRTPAASSYACGSNSMRNRSLSISVTAYLPPCGRIPEGGATNATVIQFTVRPARQ